MSEQIKEDDVVQVVKGGEWGVMGVVMSVVGKELLIWGRNPGYLGSESYKLQVPKSHVMLVGRGKVRPLRPGESRKQVPDAGLQQTTAKPEPKAEPDQKVEPEPQPQKRGPGRPRKNPLPEESAQKPATPTVRDETSAQEAALQFGMDVELEDLVPKPKPQEEINPELLKTVQVRRPSAYDIHKQE